MPTHAINYQPRLLHFFLGLPLDAGMILIGGKVTENRLQLEIWNGIRKPPGRENAFKVVLSISPNNEDRASLKGILESDWTVVASSTVASALSLLREISIPIVICDCEITSGTWGEMLDDTSRFPDPPLLIVTSRLADERLWAEALNLGAWDVLAKPFDADEVVRVVDIARQHWQDRHRIHITSTEQWKSTNGSGHLDATGT
jgi:DNA-binding NtrC family response regulator